MFFPQGNKEMDTTLPDLVISFEQETLWDQLIFIDWEQDPETCSNEVQRFINYCDEQFNVIRQSPTSWETTYLYFKKLVWAINYLLACMDCYKNFNQIANGEDLHKRIEKYRNIAQQLLFGIYKDSVFLKKFKSLKKLELSKFQQLAVNEWLNMVFGEDITPAKLPNYFKLSKRLSRYCTKYTTNNQQIHEHESFFHVSKPNSYMLKGVSEYEKGIAAQNAKDAGQTGWMFSLTEPTVNYILYYAPNRSFREKVYKQYQKKMAQLENHQVVKNILTVKHEIAKLYDKKNYSELVLSNYVINTPEKAYNYLDNIENELKPLIDNINDNMSNTAKEDGIKSLKPWDIPFYYNKIKETKKFKSRHAFTSYYTWKDVLPKLLRFFTRQFDIVFTEIAHPLANKENGLLCYRLKDRQSERHGYLMLSPFNGTYKITPHQTSLLDCEIIGEDTIVPSVQYVSLMIEKTNRRTALSFYDILTTLHEFGHAFHTFFGGMEDSLYNNGKISWDLIEMPSQFLEHLIYDKSFMQYLSSHYKTGEKITEDILSKEIEKQQFFEGYEIYCSIQKFKACLWLHENFKPFSKQMPWQIIDERLNSKGIFYNIANDNFMTYENHHQDYGPAGYMYFYSAQLAFQVFEFFIENKGFHKPLALRNIYTNVFNTKKTLKMKQHLEKFVDLSKVNTLNFLKKTWNIDLYGTNTWHDKESNLHKAIIKSQEV